METLKDRPDAVLFDKDGTILPFVPFWTTWTMTFRATLTESVGGLIAARRPDGSDGPTHGGLLDWPANTRTASHGASLDVATMASLRERVIAYLVAEGVPSPTALGAVAEAGAAADARSAALPVEAHDGFVPLVRGLARHETRMAVVTGDDEARAVRQVAALGLGTELSVVVGGDRGLPGKPDPSTLLFASERLAVDPSDCVYVGDSLVDVRAARAAGFRGVLAYVPLDALAEPGWSHEADGIVRSFTDLADRWCSDPAMTV